MSVYDGQGHEEGMLLLEGETEDMLFTEQDSRKTHRVLNSQIGDRQDVGALLSRLQRLADNGSHRATYLLGELVQVLPSNPESIVDLVANTQITDRSGLAVNYDNTVGTIYQVQGQKV